MGPTVITPTTEPQLLGVGRRGGDTGNLHWLLRGLFAWLLLARMTHRPRRGGLRLGGLVFLAFFQGLLREKSNKARPSYPLCQFIQNSAAVIILHRGSHIERLSLVGQNRWGNNTSADA